MTYNGQGLAFVPEFEVFQPERPANSEPKAEGNYKSWTVKVLPEPCTVNEQKVEIFILLLNRVFSARNYCPIANKKLMKCTSRPAIANAM